MDVILGNFTWSALVKRESLSLLHSVYGFVHDSKGIMTILNGDVRQELFWMCSILPLLACNLDLPWSDQLFASDASGEGYGVCVGDLGDERVGEIGRVSESRRYDLEDAIHARSHVLSSICPSDPSLFPIEYSQFPSRIHNLADQLSPDDLSGTRQNSWKLMLLFRILILGVFFALGGGKRVETSCALRALLALLWPIRRCARGRKCHSHRLLLLVDNLSLCLALTKGRSSSVHLLPTCRSIFTYAVATGSRICTRWIPSEVNPADPPSRGLPLGDHASPKQLSQEPSSLAKPNVVSKPAPWLV